MGSSCWSRHLFGTVVHRYEVGDGMITENNSKHVTLALLCSSLFICLPLSHFEHGCFIGYDVLTMATVWFQRVMAYVFLFDVCCKHNSCGLRLQLEHFNIP